MQGLKERKAEKIYITWKNLLINNEGLSNQFKTKINLNPYTIWKIIVKLQLEKLYFSLEMFDFFCYTKVSVYLHSELYTYLTLILQINSFYSLSLQ